MNDAARDNLLTAQSVTVLGMGVNAALSVGKIAVGFTFASQTLLADGFHSASDLISDVAVLAGLRAAERPADECHPYGHGRVTALVAMFVGAMLLGAAAWIGYNGLTTQLRGAQPVRAAWPFWVACASVPLKELLYQITRFVGRRENNLALTANAWHHRSDALTSVAAAAGLAGVWLGGANWQFLDAVTAVVLSAFLVVTALRIIRRAAGELIDRAPGVAMIAKLARVTTETDGVRGYHQLRARQIGGRVAMDIHVFVDPDLSVRAGHHIASEVRRRIELEDPNVIEVVVHVEPAEA